MTGRLKNKQLLKISGEEATLSKADELIFREMHQRFGVSCNEPIIDNMTPEDLAQDAKAAFITGNNFTFKEEDLHEDKLESLSWRLARYMRGIANNKIDKIIASSGEVIHENYQAFEQRQKQDPNFQKHFEDKIERDEQRVQFLVSLRKKYDDVTQLVAVFYLQGKSNIEISVALDVPVEFVRNKIKQIKRFCGKFINE